MRSATISSRPRRLSKTFLFERRYAWFDNSRFSAGFRRGAGSAFAAFSEPFRLNGDIALAQVSIDAGCQSAEGPREPKRQSDSASDSARLHQMLRFEPQAETLRDPTEAFLRVEFSDPPNCRKKLWLLYSHPASHRGRSRVQSPDIRHCGRPFRPTLHGEQHRHDLVTRRFDINGNAKRSTAPAPSVDAPKTWSTSKTRRGNSRSRRFLE